MNIRDFILKINAGGYDGAFAYLYGINAVDHQRSRYANAAECFGVQFGPNREIQVYSTPGRTEIGGNHTDHNHGRVLAAGVSMDVIAIVSLSKSDIIRIQSAGYPMDTVDINDLSVRKEDINHSASLIRGVADGFIRNGYKIGGFDAYTTSNVLKGSGLSSSAAFEVLVGTIMSYEFNNGEVNAVDIAKLAQYAENVHFGKPSGLMDQMAASVGGMIAIDFKDPAVPIITKVNFDFAACGYRLCVIETGGDHTDLTGEYAAVPSEMKEVASSLGVGFLRETSLDTLYSRLPELREKHGDRAVLRAIHFLCDNERVARQTAALESGDFELFMRLVTESGHSSFEYLQNVYVASDLKNQGMSVALAAAQTILNGRGAWRVHGGGFAGTILCIVPEDMVGQFSQKMESLLGKGCCFTLSVRPVGGVNLDRLANENH